MLDVGSGYGGSTRMLADMLGSYNEIIGIDTREERIEEAAEKTSQHRVAFAFMDAAQLSFDDESFDTVAIFNSLHHLDRVESVLEEMKRVLRTGGLFLICEVYNDPKENLPNMQRHLHHWWAEINRLEGITHNETFTRREIIEFVDRLALSHYDTLDLHESFEGDEKEKVETSMIASIDEYIEKIEDKNRYHHLVERGQQLKTIYTETGFTWDPELCVLGRK